MTRGKVSEIARKRRLKEINTTSILSPRPRRFLVFCFFPFLVLGPALTFWRTAAQSNDQPIAVGWGGSRLKENLMYTDPGDASIAFPGELASDQERLARRLADTGHNAIRVSFAPYCTDRDGSLGRYNSTRLTRAIRIAETLGLWIIVDYHGYREFGNQTIPRQDLADCWLKFWLGDHNVTGPTGVVGQFKDRYPKLIWEPLNELAGFHSNTTMVSYWYQKWIDQARDLGDEHWIVVQNVCSYGCSLDYANGFPSVSDRLGRTFLSIHPYMPYWKYYKYWNNTTTESLASKYYSSMLTAMERTGLPLLNTEGGPGSINVNGGNCPDLVLIGTTGYCTTNFHFIQTLTNLLDSNQPQRISWLWWPVGNWPVAPGAGIFGALSPTGWGSLLSIQRTPTFRLIIKTRGSGTTFPGPGNYAYTAGTIVNISATPLPGNGFDHWELNGGKEKPIL